MPRIFKLQAVLASLVSSGRKGNGERKHGWGRKWVMKGSDRCANVWSCKLG